MRILVALALAGLLVAGLSGCGTSFSVKTDYDKAADFSTFKTFNWIPGDYSLPNKLNDKRLRTAVEAEMVVKGYSKSEAPESADFLMAYTTMSKEKVDVWTSDYYYTPRWGGYNDVDVYQYTEGTLVVDIVDRAKNEVVWRGSATAVIDESPKEEDIKAGVTKLFADFPPDTTEAGGGW